MRWILFLLFPIISFSQPCSIYGDKPVKKFQILDSLKNRNFTGKVDSSISLHKILTRKGDDTKDYNSSQYAHLEGYVILVKYGGSETCNCKSKVKTDLDIHIELALQPNATNKQAMVLEINRYTRKDHPEFTLENIKKLVGKKVKAEGFMFLDSEHLQNSMTTNPTGKNNWRASAWELHNLMSIKEIL